MFFLSFKGKWAATCTRNADVPCKRNIKQPIKIKKLDKKHGRKAERVPPQKKRKKKKTHNNNNNKQTNKKPQTNKTTTNKQR